MFYIFIIYNRAQSQHNEISHKFRCTYGVNFAFMLGTVNELNFKTLLKQNFTVNFTVSA